MNKKNVFLAVLFSALVLTSCGDDKETPQPTQKESPFLIETTVKNSDGMSGSSYVQLISELSGKIDNSNAIQVDFNAPIGFIDNQVFIFPTFGKDASPYLQKYIYSKTGGSLTKAETLTFSPNSGASNIVKVSNTKAYVPAYNIGKVIVINPESMKKTGEIDLSKYAHGDNSPEPAYGIIRDGLYYLPLDQAGADYMPYKEYRQVDVAIIDTKTDKVKKVISETTSNMSFPTRPMLENMIFTDENNDIYIACVGYFGYNPNFLENGFVCIPSGKTEFDTSKSWDISKTTISGTSYKPASVVNCQYLGSGKLVAFVSIIELMGKNPYTAKNNMAVLIDMKAKTIKKIDGIPTTDGHSVALNMYNNLVVMGIYGTSKSGFYTYNPSTEEAKHVLDITGNPTLLHVF